MVLAKTQIRSRLESQNAQREKKIAQLNEFIARFSAGTRSSQVTSRKKEVERLQTTELARSNIAAPVHPLRHDAALGQAHPGDSSSSPSRYGELAGDQGLQRQRDARREGLPDGPQRPGQDDAAEVAAGRKSCREQDEPDFTLDGGTVKWGHEAQIGYFPQDQSGSIEKGMTVADWLHQFDPTGDQGRYSRHCWDRCFSAAKRD